MKVTKSYIKKLIKEELEAVLNEGDRRFRSKYDTNPRDYTSPNLHPSDRREAPDFSTPDMQMRQSISAILRDNTILSISQSGMTARKIAKEFHGKEFEEETLKDFLMKNTFLQEDESAIAAKEIVKQMNK